MQLNKQLALLAVTAGVSPLLNATSSDEIGIKHTFYQENSDRMKINFTTANITADIGADYTINLSLSHDSMSGGTPVWDSISGASSGVTDDAHSGASPCIDENGLYICKETRDGAILGDGHTDMSDFVYRNVDMDDKRTAGAFSVTKRTQSRDEITLGASYSKESDFKSMDGSFSYLYNLDASRNKSILAGISYQYNDAEHYDGWDDFNNISGEIGYTQVFTKDTLASFNIFGARQKGNLDGQYQTIIRYFDVALEGDSYFKYYRTYDKRPDERNSYGFSAKVVSKVLPKLTLNGGYRLYKDDWGILSHTLKAGAYVNITKNIAFAPFVRYYSQSDAVFYKDYDADNFTFSEDSYGSNDERLGDFDSVTLGAGLIVNITKDLSVDVHFTHQSQTNDLKFYYVSAGINYSF